MADEITKKRMAVWNKYYEGLSELEHDRRIELPYIPDECEHNAHMFYLKAKNLEERTALIAFLKENGVQAVFHYIPLHSSPAGMRYGRIHGEDVYTTRESERLVRLPLYYSIEMEQVEYVIEKVKAFYKSQGE